jgi:Putative zinc-finger
MRDPRAPQSPPPAAHPHELLAGLVDGTLSPRELAEARAHLEVCERCRMEVEAAERARAALAGLPQLDVSWDVSRPAIEQARRRRGRRPSRLLAGVGAAVAAAVVGVFAWSALHGGGGHPAATSAEGSPSASDQRRAPVAGGSDKVPLIVTSTDFDAQSVERLAGTASRSVQRNMLGANEAPAPFTPSGVAAPAPEASTPAVRNAIRCLARAANLPPTEVPRTIIQARFDGRPALIGVYVQHKRAGQPNRVTVRVASSTGCVLLHRTSTTPG